MQDVTALYQNQLLLGSDLKSKFINASKFKMTGGQRGHVDLRASPQVKTIQSTDCWLNINVVKGSD